MPKKILLIESDAPLAAELSEALEGAGFEVRATGDGKEGLELARDAAPAAIVLSVELPGMSGYLVCQKLKKDDVLKDVPLVLTSAEATQETFDKHRTLKARADEYLLKPYAPERLVEILASLVGLPAPADDGVFEDEEPEVLPDEELVSLEEEMGLEALSDPVEDLPSLDLQSLPDEPIAGEHDTGEDDDLRLLDDAFEGLASPPASGSDELELDLGLERPFDDLDVEAAEAALAAEDDRATRSALRGLADESDADLALDALAAGDDAPAVQDTEPAARPTVRGASAELLRAAGIPLLDDDEAPDADAAASSRMGAPAADVARLERALDEARAALEGARGQVAAGERSLREAQERAEAEARRADGATAKVGQLEDKLADVEEKLAALAGEAQRSEADAAEARRRASDAEARAQEATAKAKRSADEAAAAAGALARVEELERELDGVRTDLLVARGEADGARGEIEKRTSELRRRVQELEAANSKNEERVLKAYQKIKADEKVREKVRKALAIAAQLMDDGLPQEPAGEKERRAAAALVGRD
jgi:CheY-like chemotaxis protein